MAHFAQLDDTNTVINVIVVHNNELLDENNQELESKGIAFCQSLYGKDTIWVQTSYNSSFRKNYAGIGSIYDPIADYFYAKKPYPSWTLNENTAQWEAPKSKPEGLIDLIWNEDKLDWEQP